MKPFNISRINTDFGIFRVSGHWFPDETVATKITMRSLEIMGTDGWLSLDLASSSNAQLINKLQLVLLHHLLSINP